MENSATESLLRSWLRMGAVVRGNRFFSETSFNKMIAAGYVLTEKSITLTELCSSMGMLKSQMNKLLGEMEAEGLIAKAKDTADKRRTLIFPTDKCRDFYHENHAEVTEALSHICMALGEEDTYKLTELLTKATLAYSSYVERKNK